MKLLARSLVKGFGGTLGAGTALVLVIYGTARITEHIIGKVIREQTAVFAERMETARNDD